MASFSFATMDYGRQGPLAPFSPPAAFVAVLQGTPQRWPYCDHRRTRNRNATLLLSSSSKSSSGSSGSGSGSSSGGEAQHSEQRPGFRPPAPQGEDGHVVDLLSLEDLFDSGEHVAAYQVPVGSPEQTRFSRSICTRYLYQQVRSPRRYHITVLRMYQT